MIRLKSLLLCCIFLFFFFSSSFAQQAIISGPMIGQVELRTAAIWLEADASVSNIQLRCWKSGSDKKTGKIITSKSALGNEFNPVILQVGGLEPATAYTFEIECRTKTKSTVTEGNFTTKDLWQWRKPVPDFSFITGSCNYVNEPVYDRPGKPYGGDSSIFIPMSREKADFMLWLGDNWYTRDVDFNSN
jgi:alkaline phosphatase D